MQVPERGSESENTSPSMRHPRRAPATPGLHLRGRSGGHFQGQFLQVSLGANGCGFLQGKQDEEVVYVSGAWKSTLSGAPSIWDSGQIKTTWTTVRLLTSLPFSLRRQKLTDSKPPANYRILHDYSSNQETGEKYQWTKFLQNKSKDGRSLMDKVGKDPWVSADGGTHTLRREDLPDQKPERKTLG